MTDDTLKKLEQLREGGVLTDAEYQQRRAQLTDHGSEETTDQSGYRLGEPFADEAPQLIEHEGALTLRNVVIMAICAVAVVAVVGVLWSVVDRNREPAVDEPLPAELADSIRTASIEAIQKIADAEELQVSSARGELSEADRAAWRSYLSDSLSEIATNANAEMLCKAEPRLQELEFWPPDGPDLTEQCAALNQAVDELQAAEREESALKERRAALERVEERMDELQGEFDTAMKDHLTLNGEIVFRESPNVYEVIIGRRAPSPLPRGGGIGEENLRHFQQMAMPPSAGFHAVLKTTSTVFESKGRFSLPVKEAGSTEVTLKSGFTESWPVYIEASDSEAESIKRRFAEAVEEKKRIEAELGDQGPQLSVAEQRVESVREAVIAVVRHVDQDEPAALSEPAGGSDAPTEEQGAEVIGIGFNGFIPVTMLTSQYLLGISPSLLRSVLAASDAEIRDGADGYVADFKLTVSDACDRLRLRVRRDEGIEQLRCTRRGLGRHFAVGYVKYIRKILGAGEMDHQPGRIELRAPGLVVEWTEGSELETRLDFSDGAAAEREKLLAIVLDNALTVSANAIAPTAGSCETRADCPRDDMYGCKDGTCLRKQCESALDCGEGWRCDEFLQCVQIGDAVEPIEDVATKDDLDTNSEDESRTDGAPRTTSEVEDHETANLLPVGDDQGRLLPVDDLETEKADDANAGGPALTKDEIRAVIGRHRREVKRCYESALQANRNISGRVVLKITIGATGDVVAATVKESTLGDVPTEQCMTAAVRKWTFPAPMGGQLVVVNYPFNFSN